MRLPDRLRLVLHSLLARGRSSDDACLRLDRSVAEIDQLLLELRRSLTDALVLRRAAEGRRDEAVAEARATPGPEAQATRQRAEAELANLVHLEEMLGAAETELHDQVSSIRDRIAAAGARETGAEAVASLTRAARAAELRSKAADEAVRELKAQVAAAEGGVEAAFIETSVESQAHAHAIPDIRRGARR